MEKHQLTQIQEQVHAVHDSMQRLTVDEPLTELLGLIHKPGWTTLAESTLVAGILDAMQAHTDALAGLKKALLRGASEVELNPQPLPPDRRPDVEFNPQPDPPGRSFQTEINPQPLPPGRRPDVEFNPQPDPPGRRMTE